MNDTFSQCTFTMLLSVITVEKCLRKGRRITFLEWRKYLMKSECCRIGNPAQLQAKFKWMKPGGGKAVVLIITATKVLKEENVESYSFLELKLPSESSSVIFYT